MSASKRKNLLLCLDAFDTLFTPSIPIPIAYAQAASRHGINVPSSQSVASSFKSSFKQTAQKYPNYGKQTAGLSPEKWWGTIIESTFSPFLKPGQKVPESLTRELLHHYSSSKGYSLFPDVTPFFDKLRLAKQQSRPDLWPWERTITGIITNSDDRVPGILSSFGFKIASRRYGAKGPTEDNPSAQKSIDEMTHGEEADIDFVVLSYDAGYEKPHPRIFSAAEDMLSGILSSTKKGREAELERKLQADDFEKLYVGDDVEKDYFGAQEAGWGSLFLQRDQSVESGLGVRRIEVVGKDGKKRKVDSVSSLSGIASWRPV